MYLITLTIFCIISYFAINWLANELETKADIDTLAWWAALGVYFTILQLIEMAASFVSYLLT